MNRWGDWDPEALIADFHRRQKRYARYKKRFINEYKVSFLEVSYESLVADFDAEINKVLKFLEIDNLLALSSEFVKVNPDSLEDIVENYGDVKQTLTNTEFEKFLD